MANLDISDLLILKEIHRSGSITRSVEHIGLSQPSISIRLNHLRKHFGDALFVRTSAGMQATPRMEGLLPKIEQALELLAPNGADAPFDRHIDPHLSPEPGPCRANGPAARIGRTARSTRARLARRVRGTGAAHKQASGGGRSGRCHRLPHRTA